MKVDLLAGTHAVRPGGSRDRVPRVLVFDSGLGGLTVHAEIARRMPAAELIYVADTAVFPYGRLGESELVARVNAVIGEAVRRFEPDMAVIACNTASTLALPVLRANHAIPFVGTVPAIKPAAAQSASRAISVLATAGTVARDYTRELIAEHARGCAVTLVGSANLASIAEAALNGERASDEAVLAEIAPAFVDRDGARTDVIVLACTHYPLILDRLKALAPWPVTWIDSAPAIARRAADLAGEVADDLPPPPPMCALFTSNLELTPALRGALAARGIPETGVLPVAAGDKSRC